MRRTPLLWIIGGFTGLAFLIYGVSLTNVFVRWDDGLLIYENPAIRAITPHTLKTIFTTFDPELYIPLTFFTYQIDYLIGGTNPALYHLQSLLWHIGNALLIVWMTSLLLSREPNPEARIPNPFALLMGLLFLVHPLHTEAVAWASARKDVLSTFFFLSSIIEYLRYRTEEGKAARLTALVPSLVLFLCGLLAKVTVITLPVVLLLIDFFRHRRWSLSMFLEKIPFFVLSAIFGIVAWIGKTGVIASSNLSEKILMAPRSAIFYLEKIFVPIKLSVLYPFAGDVTLQRTDILVPFLLFLVLIVLTLVTLKWTRAIFFCIVFYLVTVSPTLGNFAKGDFLYFASDRYAYVPSIGIILLVILLLSAITQGNEQAKRWGIGASIAVVTVFSIGSFLQSLVWKDSATLFGHALALYPESYVAENNLGNVWRTQGDEAQAIAAYEQALAIMERYGRKGPGLLRAQSKTLSNLASAKREQGDIASAQATYAKALALSDTNEFALLGLGIIAGQMGNLDEAERYYRQAIADNPSFATAQLNLGALLVQTGRIDEGIAAYRSALSQNPFFPQAHFNLAVALEKAAKPAEAEEAYRAAINAQPRYTAARINLGILLYDDHRVMEAKEQFESILQYDPGNRRAQSALSQIGTK